MMNYVILFACMGAAVLASDPAPSYGGGPGYGYNDPSTIIYEIRALLSNVTVLGRNDEAIDMTLEKLLEDNRLNSILRETFLNDLYPDIQKEQAIQDARLTSLEQSGKALLSLSNDVSDIATLIDLLNAQLVEINQTKAEYEARIVALRNANGVQDASLATINSDLAAQEAKLEELRDRSHAVADRIAKLEKTLHQVFDAVNTENAETVEATLTPDNSEVTIYLNADFGGRRAEVQYGVTSLHVSDHENSVAVQGYYSAGYGGYESENLNLPNINFNIDAELDREGNKLTLRLFDLSQGGWEVNKVTVSAVVYRIDESLITTYA